MQLLEAPQELRKCPFDRQPLHSPSLADYQVNYTLCSMLDERIESWRMRGSSLKVRSDRLLMNATGGNIYEGTLTKHSPQAYNACLRIWPWDSQLGEGH